MEKQWHDMSYISENIQPMFLVEAVLKLEASVII